MVLDATTIGRLSCKHLLPRGEIMNAIKGISPIGCLMDSSGERIYPLAQCEAALTRLFVGQPKGIPLKSIVKILKITQADCLASLDSLGLGFCGANAVTPVPHMTFKYILEDLQKKEKISSKIVSVVELSMKYAVTEVHIVTILNFAFVPLILRSKYLAYRFYDRPAAERALKEKLSPVKVKASIRSGNFRTFGMLLTEFYISRIDLSAIAIALHPEKRWGMNAKMARVYYEEIKHELITKGYRKRS
jgi:hypothetical protein